MHGYTYLRGVATLQLDPERCIGCGACVLVCPHRILTLTAAKIEMREPDLCMECGACAQNCPVGAVTVTPGVGCAVAILGAWINRFFGRKMFSDCC
ncbi:MAG: mercury methylation ferredoxin HgcB [Desulfobulbus sp.]|nr:mercury methylation ferredoxin HgcB [Desulfobulbus sp.]